MLCTYAVDNTGSKKKKRQKKLLRRASRVMRGTSELTFVNNILNIFGLSTSDPTKEAIDNISDSSSSMGHNSIVSTSQKLVRKLSNSLHRSSVHAVEYVKDALLTSILPKSSCKVTPITGDVEGQ